MKTDEWLIEKRLRTAGVLLIFGLAVEACSLFWSHPTAFLLFLFVGGLALLAGVLVYLYALLPTSR